MVTPATRAIPAKEWPLSTPVVSPSEKSSTIADASSSRRTQAGTVTRERSAGPANLKA
jgi:hypothetical protein